MKKIRRIYWHIQDETMGLVIALGALAIGVYGIIYILGHWPKWK